MIIKLIAEFQNIIFSIPNYFKNKIRNNSNVAFYDWDDYNTHLEKAKLHITHGGINSIKDSIDYGIPMLITPLNWQADQIHNALIFEKLGLSKTWNILLDSKNYVKNKIEELIHEKKYKENIEKYCETCIIENPILLYQEKFFRLLKDDTWAICNL